MQTRNRTVRFGRIRRASKLIRSYLLDSIHPEVHALIRNRPRLVRETDPDVQSKGRHGLEGSNLDYQIWAIAIYQVTTNLKGVSSMKLQRDPGITQKSV